MIRLSSADSLKRGEKTSERNKHKVSEAIRKKESTRQSTRRRLPKTPEIKTSSQKSVEPLSNRNTVRPPNTDHPRPASRAPKDSVSLISHQPNREVTVTTATGNHTSSRSHVNSGLTRGPTWNIPSSQSRPQIKKREIVAEPFLRNEPTPDSSHFDYNPQSYRNAPPASSAIPQTNDLIDMNPEKPVDSTGMHNVKKGFFTLKTKSYSLMFRN